MEEVTQRFAADVESYVAEVGRAATEARDLAGATEEVKFAADGMRDKVTEAAAALKITRDEMGKLRNASGEVITASEAQALALKHIRDQALEAAFAMRELDKYEKPSMFSRLGGLLGGGGSGGAGGGLSAGDLAPGLGSPTAIISMIAAVEAAIMIIGPEVGALATGLTAAGLGVGSFAALAVPALKSVTGEYQALNAVNQKYQQAVALEKMDPTKGHAAAVKAALDQVNLVGQAYQKLPNDEQGAVDGLYKLTHAFQAQAKAFQPTAFKVFNEALGVANQLLPYLGQFAAAVAPAIEHLIGGLGRFVGGGQFRYFMGFLQSLAGPVLEAVGSGMAGLGLRLMTLMELFSKKDVINSVNIAFRVLGFLLQLTQGLIMEGMDAWDILTQTVLPDVAHWFDVARHAVASFAHGVAHDFDDVRHDVAEFGHDVAHYFDDARHDVAEFGHGVAVAFDDVRHAVAVAVTDTVGWVRDHWKIILAWLVAPIGMAVFEIKTHTHQIAQAFDELRHDVAAILAGARHDVAAFADWAPHAIRVAWDTVRHDTAAAMDWVRHEIAHAFDSVRHDIAAATGDVRHEVAAAWDWLRHATATAADAVAHFFEQLPGRILSYLASLPAKMADAGKNVILGLIRGIESAASQIPSIMRGLASDVASYFTNPLKLFSPSRVFFDHGVNIVLGAINGVRSMAPQLQQVMRQLGSGVATGGIPGAGAGGGYGAAGGGRVNVTVPLTAVFGAATGFLNDPHFLQYIQTVIQEAVLRYNVNNPGNGLAISAGGRPL
jgi:phage-related protein